jgi:hypothetical protein
MRLAGLVALVAFAVYLGSFRTITGIDAATNALLAYSLARDRDPYLDEFVATYDRISFWSLRAGAHAVSPYPPGAALVGLPFAAVGTALGIVPPQPASITVVAKAAAVAASAGSVFFVFLLAATVAGRRLALVVAALYAFGTVTWPISAGALWQHGPAQLFLAIGLLWLRPRAPARWAARAGLAFGLATLCRLTDAAFAIASLGYAAIRRRQVVPGLLAWATLCVALLVSYGLFAYGEAISSGYLALNYADERPSVIDVLVGLAGSFVAPDRGLFVYSPFLLLSAYELIRRSFGRDELATFLRAQLIAVAAIVLATAATVRWWGGYGYGDRYLADALPLLALGLALWLRHHHRRVHAIALALLAAPAVVVMALGAIFYDWQSWSWERARAIPEAQLQWTLDDPQWWFTLRHVPERLDAVSLASLAIAAAAALFYLRLWTLTPRTVGSAARAPAVRSRTGIATRT